MGAPDVVVDDYTDSARAQESSVRWANEWLAGADRRVKAVRLTVMRRRVKSKAATVPAIGSDPQSLFLGIRGRSLLVSNADVKKAFSGSYVRSEVTGGHTKLPSISTRIDSAASPATMATVLTGYAPSGNQSAYISSRTELNSLSLS
jgi:hypothetical protein